MNKQFDDPVEEPLSQSKANPQESSEMPALRLYSACSVRRFRASESGLCF
jgi:hypothetical protein